MMSSFVMIAPAQGGMPIDTVSMKGAKLMA